MTNTYDARNQLVMEETVGDSGARLTRRMGYDPNGNLAWSTDYNGNQTDYTYDVLNHLNTVTQPAPGLHPDTGNQDHGRPVIDYDYYNDGLIARVNGPAGESTYTYDNLGRPITVVGPAGTTRYAYSTQLNTSLGSKVDQVITTDVLNRSSLTQTDGYGRQVLAIAPNLSNGSASGPATRWVYDARGNLASTTNATGRVTSYQYVGLDRLHTIKETIGSVTKTQSTRSYHLDGKLRSETALDGTETNYRYDDANRLESSRVVSQGQTATTQWQYDTAGDMVQYTSPSGDATAYAYDDFGRLTSETINLVNGSSIVPKSRTYQYDNNGNVLSKTDRNNRTTAYQYDNLGRLVTETSGSTSYVAQYHYDAAGRVTNASDLSADSQASSYGYTYDAAGFVDKVTQSNSSAPGTHVFDYQFDGAGQKVSRNLTRNGSTISSADYVYDRLGRIDQMTESGSQSINSKAVDYLYHDFGSGNGDGQLKKVTRYDSSFISPSSYLSHTDYSYDAQERLTDIHHQVNGDVTDSKRYNFQYDSVDRINRIVPYKNSLEVTSEILDYTHGSQSQLTRVSNDGSTQHQYSYDANGNRESYGDREGFVRPHDRVIHDGNFSYSYDDEGNVSQRTGHENILTMSVARNNWWTETPEGNPVYSNTISQFSDWLTQGPGTSSRYRLRLTEFDVSGFASDADSTVTMTVTIWKNDDTLLPDGDYFDDPLIPPYSTTLNTQVSTVFPEKIIPFVLTPDDDVRVEVHFDLGGGSAADRRIEVTGSAYVDREEAHQYYTWDYRNRLVEMESQNGDHVPQETFKYRYDVMDNLVGRERYVPGVATPQSQESYVTEGGRRLLEYGNDDTLALAYTYSPVDGSLVANDILSGSNASPQLVWALGDHQGTPRDFYQFKDDGDPNTFPDDKVTPRKYDPFGNPISSFAETDPGKIGFQGMVYDSELKMYFSGGRWYNARSGRYASESSGGHLAGASNLYVFAGNTPVNRNGAAEDNYRGDTASFSETFNEIYNPTTRLLGAAQAFGGIAETVAGGALWWTGAGIVFAGRGLDDFQAGLRAAWTGQQTETLTYHGVKAATGSATAARVVDIGSRIVSPAAAVGALSSGAKLARTSRITAGVLDKVVDGGRLVRNTASNTAQKLGQFRIDVGGSGIYAGSVIGGLANIRIAPNSADDIAFGLWKHQGTGNRNLLDNFSKHVGAKTYGDVYGPGVFPTEKMLEQMMHSGRRLHINLDGLVKSVDELPDIVRMGSKGMDYQPSFGVGNITNWEIWRIHQDPELLKKAVFYLNGKVVTP